MQEQEDMRNDEEAWSTTRKLEKTVVKMLIAISGTMSNVTCFNDENDGEDEEDDEDDTEVGKLSEDDNPGLVMGTISKTV